MLHRPAISLLVFLTAVGTTRRKQITRRIGECYEVLFAPTGGVPERSRRTVGQQPQLESCPADHALGPCYVR
jgi:hypothetical protein